MFLAIQYTPTKTCRKLSITLNVSLEQIIFYNPNFSKIFQTSPLKLLSQCQAIRTAFAAIFYYQTSLREPHHPFEQHPARKHIPESSTHASTASTFLSRHLSKHTARNPASRAHRSPPAYIHPSLSLRIHTLYAQHTTIVASSARKFILGLFTGTLARYEYIRLSPACVSIIHIYSSSSGSSTGVRVCPLRTAGSPLPGCNRRPDERARPREGRELEGVLVLSLCTYSVYVYSIESEREGESRAVWLVCVQPCIFEPRLVGYMGVSMCASVCGYGEGRRREG